MSNDTKEEILRFCEEEVMEEELSCTMEDDAQNEMKEIAILQNSEESNPKFRGEVFPLPQGAGHIISRWKENRLDLLFRLCKHLRSRYQRVILHPLSGEIRYAVIHENGAFLDQIEREDYEIFLESDQDTQHLFSFSLKKTPYFYPLRLPENTPSEKDFRLVRRLACGTSRTLILGLSCHRLEIESQGFPQDLLIKVYRDRFPVRLIEQCFQQFSFAFDYPQPGRQLYVAHLYQEKEHILVIKFMEC